jgi:hypothetical protein
LIPSNGGGFALRYNIDSAIWTAYLRYFLLIIFSVFYLLSWVLAVLAVAPVIMAELPTRLLRLALLPLIRWLPPARLCLTPPLAVILTLLLNPL